MNWWRIKWTFPSAGAVCCLETVSLDDTNLSSEQVISLLTIIAQSPDTRLRRLDMLGMRVDLSLLTLPPEIWELLRRKFKVIDGWMQCRLELI